MLVITISLAVMNVVVNGTSIYKTATLVSTTTAVPAQQTPPHELNETQSTHARSRWVGRGSAPSWWVTGAGWPGVCSAHTPQQRRLHTPAATAAAAAATLVAHVTPAEHSSAAQTHTPVCLSSRHFSFTKQNDNLSSLSITSPPLPSFLPC